MAIIDPAELEGIVDPELIFAFVAPVGTPLQHLSRVLEEALGRFQYESESIRLSDFLESFALPTPHPGPKDGEYVRIESLMSRGNELRQLLGGGEALALLCAAHINAQRPDEPPHAFRSKAFILNQLKHPDEVLYLRTIYGRAFHLIGVYCPESIRIQHLRLNRNLNEDEARQLIDRDKGEESKWGQHLTRTFHQADVFVELRGYDVESEEDAKRQITRYLDLVFASKIITPSKDEYGMFLAQAAAMRSADLSRQVGAAILTLQGEVLSVGTNDVPSAGGGQYWSGEGDQRDHEIGYDANAKIKLEALEEVISILEPRWNEMVGDERKVYFADVVKRLSGTRVMNLTEFGRAVHAEMEALLAAARVGTSTQGAVLYTTTFPCHNCAKHVVDAGISRVVYIEPYPKSLADRLHSDSITFSEEEREDGRVVFDSFRGVAPRMYPIVFSTLTPEGQRVERKDADGNVTHGKRFLRTRATPLTHIDKEAIVAEAIRAIVTRIEIEE
jgi:deoxycytidylate deaminase